MVIAFPIAYLTARQPSPLLRCLANSPNGSAVSIVMLVMSLGIIYGITRVVSARWAKV